MRIGWMSVATALALLPFSGFLGVAVIELLHRWIDVD